MDRMLVYEYMENSNLDKWLHHAEGEISQLNWDTRMHILLGTAKGYGNSSISYHSTKHGLKNLKLKMVD